MFLLILSFLLLFIIYLLFCVLTRKTEFVRVIKKFTISTNGEVIFKVHDDKDNVYVISDGMFISEKKCKELWEKIKEDEINYITFYGINVPILDCNYSIIDVR